MIRINLLPIKQDRRREAGRNQLLFGLLIIVLEIVGCVLLYMDTGSEVEAQKNSNKQLSVQVERIEKEIGDHKKILADIAEYEKRRKAIESLQAARTGPVFVLLELSDILSRGGGPHIDHDRYQEIIQRNPAAAFDENWDHRRLWLGSFQEKERRVRLQGQGLTHEDVAEFLRRINLSDFFVSSELVSTQLSPPKISKESFEAKSAHPVVHFTVEADVKYR